ncbi:MAG: hypothetical protein HY724_00595 [Candidatus Rokubacteria bacterium]|nr:hypothetical protein [Candidatus Rokubacteria bacterium]
MAYGYFGYWTGQVLRLYLLCVSVAGGGFLIGVLLRRYLPGRRIFRRVVLGLLAVNGVALVLRAAEG